MTDQSVDRPRFDASQSIPASVGGAGTQDLYNGLCDPVHLRRAYAQVRAETRDSGINDGNLEALDADGVEDFIQRLSQDLQTRTYQPAVLLRRPSATDRAENAAAEVIRDRVVEAGLTLVLESQCKAVLPCEPDADHAIQWVVKVIGQGLTRVYSARIGVLVAGQQNWLCERALRQIDDAEFVELLRKFLVRGSRRSALGAALADTAFQGIDRILQQVRALGRHDGVDRVACARFENDLIVLVDAEPRHDWVLPAVDKRLRAALNELDGDLDPTATQSVDLARGEVLEFLGFEMRCVAHGHASSRVQYKRDGTAVSLPALDLAEPQPTQADMAGKDGSVRVHPVARIVKAGFRLVRRLLIAPLCGLRLPRLARWGMRERTIVACGLIALICLGLIAHDIYPNVSREVPAPKMPPGFFLGQYNPDAPWGTDLVQYGLYLPPHFRNESGQFPLIVFLHGYEEGKKDRIFAAGLPYTICRRITEQTNPRPFEFVVFCPIDQTGLWQTDTDSVDGAMKALDYVIRRHRIDPARVYLTGPSSGGNGVWRLAESYPDKWAAIAPLSSIVEPNIQRVCHIPVWLFHGAKDKLAPVERTRNTVRDLKAAGAEVRYSEFRNKGHLVLREAYDPRALYDWFAEKKRE